MAEVLSLSDLIRCIDYLKQQHVLTLCTGNGTTLWAANCFYIPDETTVALWLMTEESTRHGQLMAERQQVAGTVTTTPASVMEIKGIQFSGEIFRLTGEREQQALRCYQERFPEAKIRQAPLWEIRLNELKMTDNTAGFGTKYHWSRPQ